MLVIPKPMHTDELEKLLIEHGLARLNGDIAARARMIQRNRGDGLC